MIILLIALLLLAAGSLGGYAGYLQGPPSPESLPVKKRISLRYRSIILGIVGAFLVPVFLSIVQATSGADKNLLDQFSGDSAPTSAWFVLFGFGLLAGVSSQRLIASLTKKLFDDVFETAETAKKIATATKEDLDDLDDDVAQMGAARLSSESTPQPTMPLSSSSMNVLEKIYEMPERRPTSVEIARAGNFGDEELKNSLSDLQAKGLITSKDYDEKEGWRVRTTGKALLAMRHLPLDPKTENSNG